MEITMEKLKSRLAHKIIIYFIKKSRALHLVKTDAPTDAIDFVMSMHSQKALIQEYHMTIYGQPASWMDVEAMEKILAFDEKTMHAKDLAFDMAKYEEQRQLKPLESD